MCKRSNSATYFMALCNHVQNFHRQMIWEKFSNKASNKAIQLFCTIYEFFMEYCCWLLENRVLAILNNFMVFCENFL